MLLVPISKIKALNWRIEVVPIEDIWVMDHNASGYRLTGLRDPVAPTEPVTLQYFQTHGSATGFTGYIPDENDAVKAHHIDWGCTADQVNAGDVPYCNNPTYPTVESALDYLLYVPLSISSFTNNVGTVEIGTTITSVTLNWAYNKSVTSQSVNQGIGSLPIGDRVYVHSSTFTTDRTYTITASDGTQTPTRNTSVLFRHYRYWGGSANTSLTDAQIIALGTLSVPEGGKEFATAIAKAEFQQDCTMEYIYYAYPAGWGEAKFIINGLLNTAFTPTVRDFTNASGNTTSFRIYRSDNILNGTYNVEVQLKV